MLWNKRRGPGGSTRRLHHKQFVRYNCFCGVETGSTRVIKIIIGVRNDTRVMGSIFINANDNFAVANDNNEFVAVAA
jgi:hypothetical protein